MPTNTAPRVAVLSDMPVSTLAGFMRGAGYEVEVFRPEELNLACQPDVFAWIIDCNDHDTISDQVGEITAEVLFLSNRPIPTVCLSTASGATKSS